LLWQALCALQPGVDPDMPPGNFHGRWKFTPPT
jgi:hypothetical protein